MSSKKNQSEIEIDGRGLRVGDYVERVSGTSVVELRGHVRSVDRSLSGKTIVALVAIEGPGEPGIGHQFVAPVEDLEVIEEAGL